jgi:N utilization substance protein B
VNEAVEIAKKYSTEESGKFVNGILGSYLRAHPRTKDAASPRALHTQPDGSGGNEEIVSGEVQ